MVSNNGKRVRLEICKWCDAEPEYQKRAVEVRGHKRDMVVCPECSAAEIEDSETSAVDKWNAAHVPDSE